MSIIVSDVNTNKFSDQLRDRTDYNSANILKVSKFIEEFKKESLKHANNGKDQMLFCVFEQGEGDEAMNPIVRRNFEQYLNEENFNYKYKFDKDNRCHVYYIDWIYIYGNIDDEGLLR